MLPAVTPRESARAPRYHRLVRKLVKLALIALGIRALWRWRQRRQAEAASLAPAPAAPAVDPADELRRKLAASRSDEPEPADGAAPEPTVEERRAEVHEDAREALDDMSSTKEG